MWVSRSSDAEATWVNFFSEIHFNSLQKVDWKMIKKTRPDTRQSSRRQLGRSSNEKNAQNSKMLRDGQTDGWTNGWRNQKLSWIVFQREVKHEK